MHITVSRGAVEADGKETYQSHGTMTKGTAEAHGIALHQALGLRFGHRGTLHCLQITMRHPCSSVVSLSHEVVLLIHSFNSPSMIRLVSQRFLLQTMTSSVARQQKTHYTCEATSLIIRYGHNTILHVNCTVSLLPSCPVPLVLGMHHIRHHTFLGSHCPSQETALRTMAHACFMSTDCFTHTSVAV